MSYHKMPSCQEPSQRRGSGLAKRIVASPCCAIREHADTLEGQLRHCDGSSEVFDILTSAIAIAQTAPYSAKRNGNVGSDDISRSEMYSLKLY